MNVNMLLSSTVEQKLRKKTHYIIEYAHNEVPEHIYLFLHLFFFRSVK